MKKATLATITVCALTAVSVIGFGLTILNSVA